MRFWLFFAVSSLSFYASIAEDSLEFKMRGILPEIEIMGQEITVVRAPEKLEGILLSGKQATLIDVGAMDANLVQNNSRQLFSGIPGVFIWESDGSGVQTGIAVRGLNPNRSWEFNVRQNGYDISSDPFGYPEAYYTPPPEAVDRILMVRGASSLQFGPQFGGLLEYRLKSGDTTRRIALESYQSAGSYGLFSTYNAVGGQLGKFNYRVSFHHRSADGWRENASYRNNHFYGRFSYSPSSSFEASVEFTALRNRLQQPGGLTDAAIFSGPRQSLRSRNWLETPWNLCAVSIRWQPVERLTLRLTNSINSSARNSIGFVNAITIPDSINASTGSYSNRQLDKDGYTGFMSELRASYDYKLSDYSHSLAFGARYSLGIIGRLQKGVGSNGTVADFNLADPSQEFANDLEYSTDNEALFAENIFHFGNGLTITPGVRLERLVSAASGRIGTEKSASYLQPDERLQRMFMVAGIGLEWQAFPTLTFHSNISSSYRPVTYSQFTPAAPTDQVDPALKDASGYTAEAGIRGRAGSWLTFDFNLFRMFYGNKVGALTLENPDNTFYRYLTNLGNSIHEGFELYTELTPFTACSESFANTRVFLSASYTDATYSDYSFTKEVNGQLQTFTLDGNRVEYAPEWIIRSGLTWSYSQLSLVFQGSYTGEVFTDANNTVDPTANAEAGKLSAYTVFDLSGKWNIGERFSLMTSVSNVFNSEYATRRASGYPGRGLMPNEARTFVFTLGITL